MKVVAEILYHIFSRLGPKIALLTLKFWDQFFCRLYRNHHCCGTGGKAAFILSLACPACPEPCPERSRRDSRGEPRRRVEGLLAMTVPPTILGYTHTMEARFDIQCKLWYT